MARVDIRVLGAKELERKLGNLVEKTQKTIVATALRKETYRTRRRIVQNIVSRGLIKTRILLKGYQGAKVKRARSGKNFIRMGVENPTRAALNIAADDPYYYPYAVEFGHAGAEPKPYIRPAIDEHRDQALGRIGNDIGSGIVREAMKAST